MGSGSSLTRHAVPLISTNRWATESSVATVAAGAMRTPLSRPARTTAKVSASTACTPTSGPSPATSPRPSSRANRKRPGNAANAGESHSAASNSVTRDRMSARPALRPDSGEATMLRTRSWVGDGSNPAAATASATASVSVMARICRLPRA